MPHRRLLAAAAALAGAVACHPSAAVAPDARRAPTGAADPVPLLRLRAEPYPFTSTSGLRAAQRTVIGDAAAWRAAWSAMWSGAAPEPPLPAVDFGREVVVLAALGERPTGGYQIFVDSASAAPGGGVVVHVRTVSPGPRCGTYQGFTQPVDLARLPRAEGGVTFRDRAGVADCP